MGHRAAVTIRNARVSPASVTVSASSLGVFCRFAPSTSAIMRSRNESPGPAETRTTISSLSTRVPPVTPERSPPASRTTGADSPVMAASSTVAAPSTTSPSPGISSPARTRTRSPGRSSSEPTCSSPAATIRQALVWRRVRRSVPACARPRASASASAKFAKRIVSQRIAATAAV